MRRWLVQGTAGGAGGVAAGCYRSAVAATSGLKAAIAVATDAVALAARPTIGDASLAPRDPPWSRVLGNLPRRPTSLLVVVRSMTPGQIVNISLQLATLRRIRATLE